jgi:hypothetical protein
MLVNAMLGAAIETVAEGTKKGAVLSENQQTNPK